MRRAVLRAAVLSTFLTLAVASAAWAHVEISPGGARAGSTETFAAEVPTEKDIPTTGVRLKVPEGFEVTDVQSPAGWQGKLEGGSIVWSGGEIGEDEVQEFTFEARTPDEAGEYALKTFQTYQDGSVVEWIGAADSEEPAPVIEVAQSNAAAVPEDHTHGVDDSHGGMMHSGMAHSEGTLPDSGGVSLTAAGIVAVVCAAGISLLVLRRRA